VRAIYLEHCALISVRVRLQGVEQGARKYFIGFRHAYIPFPSKDDGSKAELVHRKGNVSALGRQAVNHSSNSVWGGRISGSNFLPAFGTHCTKS
jgi:hypothetical protein